MLCSRGRNEHGEQIAALMSSIGMTKDWDVCTCENGCSHSHLQLVTVAPVAFVPLSPMLFGPVVWPLLHACARYCPGLMHDVLTAMEHVLPCMRCREHLTRRRTDAHGLSASQIAKAIERKVTQEEVYMFNLHNDVNKITGKTAALPIELNKQKVDIPLALQMIRGQWAYEVPWAMPSIKPASAPGMVSMLKSKVCYNVVEAAAEKIQDAMKKAELVSRAHNVDDLVGFLLLWNL